ncbi:MAG: AAA family ATPase [Bacillota bacterium]|nr:AAA family ATPase [Bacillota bacterium]
MRFDSIVISNYRQYKAINISFPRSKCTDLHVIVASNGIGKTNMLNAINWCLYGDEPHLGDKDDSLTICNHAALVEAREKGEKSAIVSVRINTIANNCKIAFDRSVAIDVSTYFPDRDLFRAAVTDSTGNTEILENDEAREIVNQYLPQKIRQYFFFDGEQLHNYFGKGQATTHVRDSIHEIAQISVVSNVRIHLEKIIEEYQKSIAKMNPKIDIFTADITTKKTERKKLTDEIAALEASIKESNDVIATLDQRISGTESVVGDNLRYNDNLKLINEYTDARKKQSTKLLELIRKYYVLLMMYDTNKATDKYIQAKFQKGVLPPDINIDLIKDSLTHHECVICKNTINKAAEDYLKSLIDKFEVSTTVSHKLVEIKNDVSRACKEASNYMDDKKEIFSSIRELDEHIASLTAENEELYKRISTCSSVENIELWMQQREENRDLLRINSEKIGSYKNQIGILDTEIASINAKLDAAISDSDKCEEIKSQLNFATEAKGIVASIENEIITEVRMQMETETMDLFEELIWKKNTYGHIELSDDYKLRLFHKITKESCLGSCSAAERELLALAFTIALHRVSGHDCLLFIDTPVGRVSDINRENFAKSLITVSEKKQLILAFTPSEFSTEISKYFNSEVLSSYNKLISPDEEVTQREAY